MGPIIFVVLCFTIALRSTFCELKSSGDDERARLPEFLTELDLASLEASQEDIEAIKTVVKRLAPEKNGEYQVYQVFFGNEELLKEWLEGAGVMGQPGVDFPALTTIPTTSFSCRGLKGGYYADLETNCQVFHICDNGRKISFLCPNGTIFQQSQLICDWWFKVDCSKSTELYEQSAEQLAEDERKRTDAKRINSEFHRGNGENEDNNGQNYYQSQNSNYDGRQNGRTNPFSQSANNNQIPGSSGQRGQNTDFKSTTRAFDPNQIYNGGGVTSNQYNQINDLAAGNTLKNSQDYNGQFNQNNYKNRQQQLVQTTGRSNSDRGNYRAIERQQNQLIEPVNEEAKRQLNYESRGANKFTGSNQNVYNNQQQSARSNQQSTEYSSTTRNSGRDGERRSFGKSSSISSGLSEYDKSSNRITPSYTETTTFRTSTPGPIREYQQLAESAAFASSRGNRYNEAYSSSQFNSYYSNFNANSNNNNNNNNNNNSNKPRVQQKTTEKPRQKAITPTPESEKIGGSALRLRSGQPPASPFPTFQPIYKPRKNDRNPDYETTTFGSTIPETVTTTESYRDEGTQSTVGRTLNNDNFESETTTSYPTSLDYQGTSDNSYTEIFTEDYARNSVTPSNERTVVTNVDFFENTTPTIISSGNYVNPKAFTKTQPVYYKSSGTSSGFTTSKPYSKSQEYRQNSVATAGLTNESTVRRVDTGSSFATTQASIRAATKEQNPVKSQDSRNQQVRSSSKSPQRAQSSYRPSQNLISTSTEKPFRSSAAISQTVPTGKTLSPYDTSITYQQGKVMSTLGPYIPFTKNYAYSTPTTSTTAKPPVYTATVPTYTSSAVIYGSSGAKSYSGKFKASTPASSVRPTGRLPSGSAAYLPEKKSDASNYLAKKHSLDERPLNEREHAMSMLQSLRGLEGTVPSVLTVFNGSRSGLNIPTSSGPSTLHSLALYFATAGDDFDVTAETRTDAETESESTESQGVENSQLTEENTSVELPKSILTQHTINSYAELFNLNNALEGNSSSNPALDLGLDVSNEDTDDLDIQQSQGPIDGARKSNSTKLRELAQVFTHALSAYLQDPDTFKKILTEIRPTEPSINSKNEDRYDATTLVPTTLEDFPSVTKEKDEVLDFSDDTAPHRGRVPTTIYPITTTDLPTSTENYNQQEFYTTQRAESSAENNFAFQVNDAFGPSKNAGNELSPGGTEALYYPEEVTEPNETTADDGRAKDDSINDYGDNYFPNDENNNKIGGFQNNSQTPNSYQPYGKNVQPFDATPISDNYVVSSTPATYVTAYQADSNSNLRNGGAASKSLDPVSKFRQSESTRKSEKLLNSKDKKRDSRDRNVKQHKSTTEPFRIRYFDTTTSSPRSNDRESLVTSGSVHSKYHESGNEFDDDSGKTEGFNYVTSVVTSRTVEPFTGLSYPDGGSQTTSNSNEETSTSGSDEDAKNQSDQKLNDHWTSSPAVTQLWESTVFVDPKRINQGLVSGASRDSSLEYSTIDYPDATESSFVENNDNNNNSSSNNNRNRESLVTDATSSGVPSRKTNNLDYPSSPWRWSSNPTTGNDGNDSPTAFTLLPPQASYSTSERSLATATPSPIYTTRSSITTTITSSVTSTSSGLATRQDPLLTVNPQKFSSRPKHGIPESDYDNEIVRAQEMFGKLNTSSTDTLMNVMKQADTNATVRQLVLLLINHCNGPMNKTMEEEKEQLLDALLRMPVNEFTSEESRELRAGINRLTLPIGKDDLKPETTSFATTTTTTTEQPIVTTFRSKKGRRFKYNSDETSSNTSTRTKNDDIVTAETSADSNALSSEDTSASDARALELLRSLYTIAAKWG
ncbi:probable serine/threonine-protein kinase DDB_G0282963 [Venturia canescens]|uniref:probable serine/threonine-protein kinase DDB_G0282963 n=1 Tax=Venturia canescens TaxID=32260 RepID=UPI001C9C3052|nr:probable serine/threonine-protein kinase DDB_G0282963 [Venturia canescens]